MEQALEPALQLVHTRTGTCQGLRGAHEIIALAMHSLAQHGAACEQFSFAIADHDRWRP
jgi:hypothetical protein